MKSCARRRNSTLHQTRRKMSNLNSELLHFSSFLRFLFSFSVAIGFFLPTPICGPPPLRRFTQGLVILLKPLFGLLFHIKTALHAGNESHTIEFLFPPNNFSSNRPVFCECRRQERAQVTRILFNVCFQLYQRAALRPVRRSSILL
jgi:hypothetical protein